jgi:hypothetical protein
VKHSDRIRHLQRLCSELDKEITASQRLHRALELERASGELAEAIQADESPRSRRRPTARRQKR